MPSKVGTAKIWDGSQWVDAVGAGADIELRVDNSVPILMSVLNDLDDETLVRMDPRGRVWSNDLEIEIFETAIRPDGHLLARLDNNELRLYDKEDGSLKDTLFTGINRFAQTPDWGYVVSSGDDVTRYDADLQQVWSTTITFEDESTAIVSLTCDQHGWVFWVGSSSTGANYGALDSDGVEQWQGSGNYIGNINASPGDLVYMRRSDLVYAIDKDTGSLEWETWQDMSSDSYAVGPNSYLFIQRDFDDDGWETRYYDADGNLETIISEHVDWENRGMSVTPVDGQVILLDASRYSDDDHMAVISIDWQNKEEPFHMEYGDEVSFRRPAPTAPPVAAFYGQRIDYHALVTDTNTPRNLDWS